jgi:hypothetical protein
MFFFVFSVCFCGPENGLTVFHFQWGVPDFGPEIGTSSSDRFVFLRLFFGSVVVLCLSGH